MLIYWPAPVTGTIFFVNFCTGCREGGGGIGGGMGMGVGVVVGAEPRAALREA